MSFLRRGNGEWRFAKQLWNLLAAKASESRTTGLVSDDNPMKLMSIAMKPLCAPPFPLDYIEEMTALMGGDGRMR